MQESFTEEPFKALMVAGAMTSMPKPVGAAASTGSKSRNAGELERGHKQPSCRLSRSPHPVLQPAARTELSRWPGIACQARSRTDHAVASQDQGFPAQQ